MHLTSPILRLLLLPAAACCLAGSAEAASGQQQHDRSEAERTVVANEGVAGAPGTRELARNRAANLTLVDDADTKAEKARENERRQVEVQAQQQSAKWAFGSMVIAGIGLLITFVATIFLAYQLYLTRRAMRDTQGALIAAREANDIARDNAYADRRPWLKITEIKFDLVSMVGDGRCILAMNVTLTNFGSTPVSGGLLICKAVNDSKQDSLRKWLDVGDHKGVVQPIGDFAPGEAKSVRTMLLQDSDSLLEKNASTISVGFVLRYTSPEEHQTHEVAQLWGIGQGIVMGSLIPIERADFQKANFELVALCRQTMRMT